jgi:hypothetical protein
MIFVPECPSLSYNWNDIDREHDNLLTFNIYLTVVIVRNKCRGKLDCFWRVQSNARAVIHDRKWCHENMRTAENMRTRHISYLLRVVGISKNRHVTYDDVTETSMEITWKMFNYKFVFCTVMIFHASLNTYFRISSSFYKGTILHSHAFCFSLSDVANNSSPYSKNVLTPFLPKMR